MYAIVEISGSQFKVSKKETVKVPKIDAEPGKTINLDKVLLIVDGDKVDIGKPLVSNVKVTAKVVSHGRDKKVMVFKKKRRKDYKVKKGHRQYFTELMIESIGTGKKSAAKPEAKKETKPAPKAEKKATAAKSAAAKSAASKKAEPKKEAVKKTAQPKETKAAAAPKKEEKKPAAKKPEAPKKTEDSKKKE